MKYFIYIYIPVINEKNCILSIIIIKIYLDYSKQLLLKEIVIKSLY